MSGSRALTTPVSQEQWLSEQTGVEFFRTPEGSLALSFNADFAKRFNCLVPISQVLQLDNSWRPVPKVIRLDKAVDAYKKSGKWQLTKQGLGKLAALAQVEKDGDPTTDFMGGAGISIVVRARQRNIDGTWRRTSATKTVWFARAERKIVREAVDDQGRALSSGEIEKRIDEFYEHVTSKTETKAWLRCVRELLGVPNQFTDRELDKPFFVMGVAFVPDWSNPHIAHMLDLQFGEGIKDLYGDPHEPVSAPVLREIPAATGSFDAPLSDADAWDDDDDDDGIDHQAEIVPASADGGTTDAGQPERTDPAPADPNPPGDEHMGLPPGDPAMTAADDAARAAFESGDDHTEVWRERLPESFTPAAGPFAGQPVENWVGTTSGQQWLGQAIPRMRDENKKKVALAWLSHGVGSPVTMDDLEGHTQQ